MGGRLDLSVRLVFFRTSLGLERGVSGLEPHLRIRAFFFSIGCAGFYSRFIDRSLFWFAGWNEIGYGKAAVERAACEFCLEWC